MPPPDPCRGAQPRLSLSHARHPRRRKTRSGQRQQHQLETPSESEQDGEGSDDDVDDCEDYDNDNVVQDGVGSAPGPARYAHTPPDHGLVSGTLPSVPSWMSANPRREVEASLHSLSPSNTTASSGSAAVSVAVMVDMDGTLPANDGMHELRVQLQHIRDLAVSTDEKARRMHRLMTDDYLARNRPGASPASPPADAVAALTAADEPGALDVGLAAMPLDPDNPYSLQPGDLDPSFSPLPRHAHGDEMMEEDDDELSPPLGCMHYKRNVKVQCFDCRRWFPCRHCHDAAHDLPFEHHLRRKLTRNMLCMLCRTPQPAAEMCVNCGEYAAWWYCPKCKLWDNDSNKRIYHCDDCGICRVGEGLGKDFVHCKRCNVCISISTSADHPCIEGATEGDCPLCLAQLFESKTAVVSLPCGHYMHGGCYRDLMAVTYKCPVCSKSAVNMELQWRKLDDEICAQPMPEDDDELEGLLPHIQDHAAAAAAITDDATAPRPRRPRSVYIGCNDCNSRSSTPFHWLGLKCQVCDSYNTTQMAPTAGRETEAERLLRQQQQHRQHDFTGDSVLRDAGIGKDAEDGAAARVDSAALFVPSSPSQQPVTTPPSPRSPRFSSGAPSPPTRGRYFVQNAAATAATAEPRRPSLPTAPYFSTPNLPTLPEMPRLPRMPHLPNLPPMMMNMPALPPMPAFPASMRSTLDLPRFSPYGVFDSLSRSLSPMRYYLQGLDVRDDERVGGVAAAGGAAAGGRPRNRSLASVRSDPTSGGTAKVRRAGLLGLGRRAGGREDDDIHGDDSSGDDGYDDDATSLWTSDEEQEASSLPEGSGISGARAWLANAAGRTPQPAAHGEVEVSPFRGGIGGSAVAESESESESSDSSDAEDMLLDDEDDDVDGADHYEMELLGHR